MDLLLSRSNYVSHNMARNHKEALGISFVTIFIEAHRHTNGFSDYYTLTHTEAEFSLLFK